MSINVVMLTDDKRNFVPLPGEQTLYTSAERTSLTLQSFNKSSPQAERFSIDCSSGRAILTNRRIIYLPASTTTNFESFCAPILNCQDTHISVPWFGPNVWQSVVQPVAGGNIPSGVPAIELKMTFKEGGSYDFHNAFERIKERTFNAVDIARESGHLMGNGTAAAYNGVHLDELPAYEDAAQTGMTLSDTAGEAHQNRASNQTTSREIQQPAPPPPRYEEVQQESIADALERRLREDEERRGS